MPGLNHFLIRPDRPQPELRCGWCPALLIGLAAWWLAAVIGQPLEAWQATDSGSTTIESVAIGFDGKVLLGRWVPVSILASGLPNSTSGFGVQVDVLDGDAVPVSYRWNTQPELVDEGKSRLNGLIRVGRAGAVTVTITTDGGPQIARRQFDLTELRENHVLLPATTRLSLILGLTDGAVAETIPVGKGSVAANAVADRSQYFPDQWIGYESVDRLLVVTQDPSGLPLRGPAIAALAQWIRLGGFAMFSCGSNSANWFQESANLESLGSVPFSRTIQTRNSGPLELLVGSNDQLVTDTGPALTMAEFEPVGATVDSTIGDLPALMVRPFGMGVVSILAFDFTEQPLADWPARRNLLARALRIEQVSDMGQVSVASGRVTHNGYEDLSGQLRAAQDQFKDVSFVTFTAVALLVTLFILLIGPGDYFFLRHVVGRMEWTWLTFTCLSLAFCGLAVGLAVWSKSPTIELNQVEIVDIDSRSMQVRGTLWTVLYSPDTSTYDIQFSGHNQLAGPLDQGWLCWQGLPGTGLGGMQTQSDLGLYRRDYVCEETGHGSRIQSLPAQNASTRTLTGRWSGQLPGMAAAKLRQSPNTDAALGTITNPFSVPLNDCVLLYGDWAYLLERPLQPGETIVVEDDMRERTVRGYYTRRRRQDSDEINVPWDPTDRDIPRILNMMMFFETIGGQAYASLSNDYQRWLDMSGPLQLGQAILTGRIREVTTPLLLDGNPVTDYDQKITVVRVLYPVQPRAPRPAR